MHKFICIGNWWNVNKAQYTLPLSFNLKLYVIIRVNYRNICNAPLLYFTESLTNATSTNRHFSNIYLNTCFTKILYSDAYFKYNFPIDADYFSSMYEQCTHQSNNSKKELSRMCEPRCLKLKLPQKLLKIKKNENIKSFEQRPKNKVVL